MKPIHIILAVILILIACYCFLFGLPSLVYPAGYGEIQPDGTYSIQGLWHLNGNALDSSGNAQNGTATGATLVYGKFGQAYDFAGGSDNRINCGSDNIYDFASSGTGDYAFSAWIYPEGWGQNGYGRILDRSQQPYFYYGYSFYITASEYSGTNILVHYHYGRTDGIGSSSQKSADYAITLNTWHFIVVSYDASELTSSIYINGEASGGGTIGYLSTNTVATLYIGIRGDYNREFNGIIDEVCLWNRTLSASEVKQLFAMQQGSYGVVE